MNGQMLAGVTVAAGAVLNGVWAYGARQVWAVGSGGTIGFWNGNAWTAESVPGVAQNLNGIWGSGPDDIWAVGDEGVILHYSP
jgi:photosystem II stability/assembly factor-like uncharacterized protein